MNNIDGVSVIICCYNSSERIERVLEHLEKQQNTEGIQWEVILVDNASEDNTAEVAQKFWTRRDVVFRIVHEKSSGLSNARRKGLEESKYDTIIFVDDDNLVSHTYIYTAYKIMNMNKDVGLAGGYGIAVSLNMLPDWFSNYKDAYAVGPQAEKDGYISKSRMYLHGAGLVMRKSVWDGLISSGFSLILSGRTGKALGSGEDSEISNVFLMAGYKLFYDSSLTFKHLIPEARLHWGYLMNLSREFGKSSVIIDLYRSKNKNFKGWDKLKTHSWIITSLSSLYNLMKLLPSYLYVKLKGTEGNYKEFRINYHYGAISQRFKLVCRFSEIKNEISRLQYTLKSECDRCIKQF